MGFLDLLSGKKKKNSVPPPVAGPGKAGIPQGPGVQTDPSKEKSQDKKPEAPVQTNIPPPPGPQPDANGDLPPAQPAQSAPSNEAPKQDVLSIPQPETKDKVSQGNNVQSPPSFSQELPKLDLPTFPSGNMGNDFEIPSFDGKKQENTQPNTEPAQQKPEQQRQGGIPPVSAPEQSSIPKGDVNIPSPGMPPSFDTTKKDVIPQVQGPSDPNAPPSFAPPKQEEQQPNVQKSQSQQQPQGLTKQWPAPSNYLNENEQSLNEMKRQLHKPNEETGTSASTIGNVQSNIKKKIRSSDSPLFVEINNYKRVLNSVDEIKRDLNESQEFVLKLDEFNDKKHNEFERWRKSFEYIQTKLQFVDKTLFKESHR